MSYSSDLHQGIAQNFSSASAASGRGYIVAKLWLQSIRNGFYTVAFLSQSTSAYWDIDSLWTTNMYNVYRQIAAFASSLLYSSATTTPTSHGKYSQTICTIRNGKGCRVRKQICCSVIYIKLRSKLAYYDYIHTFRSQEIWTLHYSIMESLHTDPIAQTFYSYNNSIGSLLDEVYFDLGNG